MNRMLAASVDASRQITIRSVAVPAVAPDQVRIAVEGCGVCASSLPLWEGRPWFCYPADAGAPGHEGWGFIEEVGSGVEHLKQGQRVAFLSDNAFAELDVAPADGVVVLPPQLDARLFPGEAVACAMNAFRRSEIEPGQTVAILGVGFLGAILVRLAVEAGARVVAMSRRKFALDLAQRLGAQEVLPLDDALDTARTYREGFDRVLEVTGQQKPLDLAGELARVRGRLVIAGYHQDGPRSVDMQLWNWKGLDVVNAHERERAAYMRGMREAVEAAVNGRIDVEALCTAFTLGQINDAFRAVEERPDGFVKAVVTT
jgi:D-arabinose 1-dehydrogenase-like Zn-dependent alcohol dehydrogenase